MVVGHVHCTPAQRKTTAIVTQYRKQRITILSSFSTESTVSWRRFELELVATGTCCPPARLHTINNIIKLCATFNINISLNTTIALQVLYSTQL